jgi:hypothetical protein
MYRTGAPNAPLERFSGQSEFGEVRGCRLVERQPFVGDRRYGSRSELEHGGFLLHAAELAFAHPVTDERLSFHEPAPAHFAELTLS